MERKYHFAYTTNKLDTLESVLDELSESCHRYAYIIHDDPSEKKPHIHFYMNYETAKTVTAVARDLKTDSNMIEIIKSPKAYLQYLTHTTRKAIREGKPQYPKEKIKANFDINQTKDDKYMSIDDLKREFRDYVMVKKGLMSIEDFFDLHGIYIVRH